MSEALDGCIEFFDDSKSKLYPKNYILFENGLSNGAYDKSCRSHIGFVNRPVYQHINLGLLCHTRAIIQHEVMHSLGFKHEHERPDRDEYVTVLFENILPEQKYNYRIMKEWMWDDLGEEYDVHSVMHYSGRGNLTPEAAKKGLNSIVFKGTNVPIPRQESLSSGDIIQLAKRYEKYCDVESLVKKKILCDPEDPSGQYYFPSKKCDGHKDCTNGADENFQECQACDVNLIVSGNHTVINGEYYMGASLYNDKPYYKRVSDGDTIFLSATKINPDSSGLWKGFLNKRPI